MTMNHTPLGKMVHHGTQLLGESRKIWTLVKFLKIWRLDHQNSSLTRPQYLMAPGTFKPACIISRGPLRRVSGLLKRCNQSMFRRFQCHNFGLRILIPVNESYSSDGQLFSLLTASRKPTRQVEVFSHLFHLLTFLRLCGIWIGSC